MWGWTAVLSLCGLSFAELEGVAKTISLLVAAAITGYAIYKLKLLEPVLKHYYAPKKRRRKLQLSKEKSQDILQEDDQDNHNNEV